jgi:NAD(P)H-dependent flavin oxidoreductase YrpB (nitropropane dioxygenase family)
MLSFGKVQPHAEKIKRTGALLICQVQTLKQAKEAAAEGADILVAQGAEGGGHGIAARYEQARTTGDFDTAAVIAVPLTSLRLPLTSLRGEPKIKPPGGLH